jgi:hypothetical protein
VLDQLGSVRWVPVHDQKDFAPGLLDKPLAEAHEALGLKRPSNTIKLISDAAWSIALPTNGSHQGACRLRLLHPGSHRVNHAQSNLGCASGDRNSASRFVMRIHRMC